MRHLVCKWTNRNRTTIQKKRTVLFGLCRSVVALKVLLELELKVVNLDYARYFCIRVDVCLIAGFNELTTTP